MTIEPVIPALRPQGIAPSSLPLVSILIRTIDRVSLIQSVESARSQTYKNVEILVAVGTGKQLQNFHARVGGKERVINQGHPLTRSEAANLLLESARGEFGLFLDDDDTIGSDHVAKLVQCLQRDPGLVAAYSDTQCNSCDASGTVSTHVYAKDFNLGSLLLSNYLPIHSVLFRMIEVNRDVPIRFDETFELFEDWEFWLRLADRGHFKRVGGVSAFYNLASASGSGHHSTESPHRIKMLRQLVTKQLTRMSADHYLALIENETARAEEINQLLQERAALQITDNTLRVTVAQLQGRVGALEKGAEQMQTALCRQQAELTRLEGVRSAHLETIKALTSSTSWKLTRPLRGLGRLIAWFSKGGAARLSRNLYLGLSASVRRHGVAGSIMRLPYYFRRSSYFFEVINSRELSKGQALYETYATDRRPVRLHPDLEAEEIQGKQYDVSVSVIIPTLNAGPEFKLLLRKLRAQQGIGSIEIVVVDSGSTDDTVALARSFNCRIVEISPAQFSHSYARNLGADSATGQYLLFMVQDAYPIGDRWLYGIMKYLVDHASQGLVAASCSEFARSDSDMMYDAMIDTHYRFLGCLERDRIGEHAGDDHMALRSKGQLSDVSCLIGRETFSRFRYRGDYAEDLDLGIRIIQSGLKVAMLASVKVIHSHNRPAYYYLKRSFVDVIFLVGMFEDFKYPSFHTIEGLVLGAYSVGIKVTHMLLDGPATDNLFDSRQVVTDWLRMSCLVKPDETLRTNLSLNDRRLEDFVHGLRDTHLGRTTGALNRQAMDDAMAFEESFNGRIQHFMAFCQQVYQQPDDRLRRELGDAIRKTYAATLGASLGFFYLDRSADVNPEKELAKAIFQELHAGV